jgi:membrane-associated protease RseP (regulator of RpoE activity)
VTSVSEDGPAAKAGIKAGDVITAVDGEAVDSPGDISRVINRKKEGDVTLTIIRNKSQQTIHVTPREGGGFSGTMGNPQIGRRIVIPRIEIRTMPEIDIAMPNIVIPSIPAINVQMPRIRVTPRVRVRGSQGPI